MGIFKGRHAGEIKKNSPDYLDDIFPLHINTPFSEDSYVPIIPSSNKTQPFIFVFTTASRVTRDANHDNV